MADRSNRTPALAAVRDVLDEIRGAGLADDVIVHAAMEALHARGLWPDADPRRGFLVLGSYLLRGDPDPAGRRAHNGFTLRTDHPRVTLSRGAHTRTEEVATRGPFAHDVGMAEIRMFRWWPEPRDLYDLASLASLGADAIVRAEKLLRDMITTTVRAVDPAGTLGDAESIRWAFHHPSVRSGYVRDRLLSRGTTRPAVRAIMDDPRHVELRTLGIFADDISREGFSGEATGLSIRAIPDARADERSPSSTLTDAQVEERLARRSEERRAQRAATRGGDRG